MRSRNKGGGLLYIYNIIIYVYNIKLSFLIPSHLTLFVLLLFRVQRRRYFSFLTYKLCSVLTKKLLVALLLHEKSSLIG